MFDFMRKRKASIEPPMDEDTRYKRGKQSLDFDERKDLHLEEALPRSTSDTEVHRIKATSPLHRSHAIHSRAGSRPRPSKARRASLKEIGALFRRDTWQSVEGTNKLPDDDNDEDPIRRIRHVSMPAQSPALVIPSTVAGHPSTEEGVIPEICISPIDSGSESSHSPSSLLRVPPSTPCDADDITTSVAHHPVSVEDDWTIGNRSASHRSPSRHLPHDYLNVEIPSATLSAPADVYQQIWGKF